MELSKSCSVAALLLAFCCINVAQAIVVGHDSRALVIDGRRRLIISGSIHYPRSTPEMWPDLIQKAKEGGIDTIETYVFWNGHEPKHREYNFKGNYDLVRFIKEIHNAGLYAILRIGPYVCAEWDYGGIPGWARNIPGMQVRTDNKQWKDEMQNFTTLIVDMMKEARLFAPQGGPIILSQIENEYGNIQRGFDKDNAKRYITWCAQMANSQQIRVPWVMCQQQDAPEPMIEACNGFYCSDYRPKNPKNPKFWTENWTGWFKGWGQATPFRPVENVAFEVARFYQKGGTLQNYYMYHGGTNFGRTSGGPYITTSYDYDAPLDEYGSKRQPKWGHLKELHASIKLMENSLLYGFVFETKLSNGVTVTKYSINGTSPACFISNDNTTADATINYGGEVYFVPAYSVSLLPDCRKEVFNTAKVTAQTSITAMKGEEQPKPMKWSWRPENVKPKAKGLAPSFKVNKLLDQVVVTSDESDYLWYMTRVNINQKGQMVLSVKTAGHVLYVFVNGRLVGSQLAKKGHYQFTYECNVKVKSGVNHISLLSATVGLANYGARYELTPTGITGPVTLTGGNSTLDLTNNTWTYKVGLDGEARKIYSGDRKIKWRSGVIPANKSFTWYQTTFESPLGTADPVVVDLLGMNKGAAWVNGFSLGRFWPSRMVDEGCNGCYVGRYEQNKICKKDCGQPSQRFYHVPRSFLKAGEPNTLTLFEEAGGDPSSIAFKTVTVGTVCARASEGNSVRLSCQAGQTFSRIDFASFGNPSGTCGAYAEGSCDVDVHDLVRSACLYKESCTVAASQLTRSKLCNDSASPAALVVQATCSEIKDTYIYIYSPLKSNKRYTSSRQSQN